MGTLENGAVSPSPTADFKPEQDCSSRDIPFYRFANRDHRSLIFIGRHNPIRDLPYCAAV
jgi:hypothetical protein